MIDFLRTLLYPAHPPRAIDHAPPTTAVSTNNPSALTGRWRGGGGKQAITTRCLL